MKTTALIAFLAALLLSAVPAQASEMTPAEEGAQLLGVVMYAKKTCPYLKANAAKVVSYIQNLGVQPEIYETKGSQAFRDVVENYESFGRLEPSCEKLWSLLGKQGSNIPGIFERQSSN